MSLKAFHIVFIIVSTVFACAFGAWAFDQYRRSAAGDDLLLAVIGFATAAALAVYGRWFLRKLKGIGYT